MIGYLIDAWQWLLGLWQTIASATADIFWDTATSMPVLIALAVIALLAFVVAHVPTIGQLIPAVAAWQRLAAIVQALAIVALLFLVGFRAASARDEAESVKNDLAWSEFQLDQQRQVADEADRLKTEADQHAAAAESALNEYQSKFGKPAACDPPPGYLDWLRQLQRGKSRTASANQPQHHFIARLRALGGQRQ